MYLDESQAKLLKALRRHPGLIWDLANQWRWQQIKTD